MYIIQMKDQNTWVTLGGRYDAATAGERVSQFVTCFTAKSAREFRVVKASGDTAAGEQRFETSRVSKSPRK